jgi:hypothetical protein
MKRKQYIVVYFSPGVVRGFPFWDWDAGDLWRSWSLAPFGFFIYLRDTENNTT